MKNYNTREIFLKILNFEKSPRTLKWEFGYWIGALRRWYSEGLPLVKGFPDSYSWGDGLSGPAERSFSGADYIDEDVFNFFKFDKGTGMLPVSPWIFPEFEKKILEETEEMLVFIDNDGIKKKNFKDLRSMPVFLDYPVKNDKDWHKFGEERLNSDGLSKRIPPGFNKYTAKLKNRDYPLGILGYPCGFFGSLRFLMGPENLFLAYYDNPNLVKKINSHLCDFWISYCEELLRYSDFDYVYIWEDMASKNGMLISPEIFNEFMRPYYLRFTDFLKARGLKNIIVDSDGYVEDLIPLLENSGVTGLLPVEKQAGNNLLRIRKNHPGFALMGGFNKAVLRDGNQNIDYDLDKELSEIKDVIEMGGYIPYADHLIPPDISWIHFKTYREQLNNIIDSTKVL